MNDKRNDLNEPEAQIEVIESWYDEKNPLLTKFLKGVVQNLDLLRFYRLKFGEKSWEEFIKEFMFMKEEKR